MTIIVDAYEIIDGLWQGRWREKFSPRFDAIVSLVSRGPPKGYVRYHEYPVRDPMWDHEMTADWHKQVELAVGMTASHVKAGRRVLVVCAAGENRSGIVVALTLRELYGWSGKKAMEVTKSKHPRALQNVNLQRYLETLPAIEEA